jgi:small-conductance mechanosensitive channel
MDNEEIFATLIDLWRDLQQPDMWWQTVSLLASLALAWLLARKVHGAGESLAGERFRVSRGDVRHLAFPLIAVSFVLLARRLLQAHVHVKLLTIAVPLLVSLAVIRMALYVLRVSFAPAAWVVAFERTIALIVWLGVALHITGLLPSLIDLLQGISFNVGRQELNAWIVLQGVATVLVTLFIALWISSLIERRLVRAETLDANLRVVFMRLSKSVLLVLAVLIGLPLVGIDLTTLSVFGGALGVGLGFGLQKIASNYVAGFIILLDRSIRLGNIISVGTDRGEVSKITTRYTVLRSLTGVEAIVPNEVLVSSVVQNESYTDPKMRIALPVQVAYASDVERAMRLMEEAARVQVRVLADPPPAALCLAFADSGINLEVGFWIADPHLGTGLLRSEINLEILRRFRDAGIEIPYPQREIRMLPTAPPQRI